MDNLARDMVRAKALGYGCHYGKYKADHPNTSDAKPEASLEDADDLVVCRHCGKEFHLNGRNRNTRYCDIQCYQEHNARRSLLRYRKRNGVVDINTRECQHCGKVFSLEDMHGGSKYCSKECAKARRRMRNKERYWKKKEAEDAQQD